VGDGANVVTMPRPDHLPNTRPAGRRALVLGGGGIAGIAWELGVLKGLSDYGVDLTGADTVIGTSAGSVVGTQITSGHSIDELWHAQLEPPDHEIGAEFGPRMMMRLLGPMLAPGSGTTKRKRIGSAALKAHPAGGAERIQVIRDRIEVDSWPERDLRITAVNAETGDPTLFDRDSGVDILHAVAASCAVPLVWPAVTIHGASYIDGGMRSTTNADLAHGAERIVVLAPLPQAFSRLHSIPRQLDRSGAAWTYVVEPDGASRAAFGRNMLDPSTRAESARAGLRQASALHEQLARVWG